MNEFSELFKKVNGWGQLKDYRKSHVLRLALFETLLLGTSKKSLEIVRLAVQTKIYSRLKKKNLHLIDKFVHDHPTPTRGNHRKTIWTIWLQGIEAAPSIVKKCYKSLKQNIIDYEIIVITEENYNQYVSFPEFILEKYRLGIISKVHFADLLRIELLSKYGGTWLDGTVFCSGLIEGKHDFYLNDDLFLYQNLKPGLDGHPTSISSWMMTASSNNNIILLTRELLHNYWKKNNRAVDYFILHEFFQMAIEAYPDEWSKVIPVSNSAPHILLLRMFDKYDEKIWNVVKEQTPFHKLSYKYIKEKEAIPDTYYSKIIK